MNETLLVNRKRRLNSVFVLGRVQRRPEIDTLRGVFLVWMTLAHLPTHLSDFVNEPFGFVSSAEGFVFLSVLLVARLHIGQAAEDGAALRTKLWKRALRIYGYHQILLACAFTMAAAFAVMAHRLALINLLNFYLAHPFRAIVGSLLLICLFLISTILLALTSPAPIWKLRGPFPEYAFPQTRSSPGQIMCRRF